MKSPLLVTLLALLACNRAAQGAVPKWISDDDSSSDCARRVYRGLTVTPRQRGPTTEDTWTYFKKFDALGTCFRECPGMYVVHRKSDDGCFCWKLDSSLCWPAGYCAGNECPVSAGMEPILSAADGHDLYDQSACVGRTCGDLDATQDISDFTRPSAMHWRDGELSECVTTHEDMTISPKTNGLTYWKKDQYGPLYDCFKDCPYHYIVHRRRDGACFCWDEQNCNPRGFCADGDWDCAREAGGVWESAEGIDVYDQTSCYKERACDEPTVYSSEDSSGASDSSERSPSSSESSEPLACSGRKGWIYSLTNRACEGTVARTVREGQSVQNHKGYMYRNDGDLDSCRYIMRKDTGYGDHHYAKPECYGGNCIVTIDNDGDCLFYERCRELVKSTGAQTARYCP